MPFTQNLLYCLIGTHLHGWFFVLSIDREADIYYNVFTYEMFWEKICYENQVQNPLDGADCYRGTSFTYRRYGGHVGDSVR